MKVVDGLELAGTHRGDTPFVVKFTKGAADDRLTVA
jgi:hypothetical protein